MLARLGFSIVLFGIIGGSESFVSKQEDSLEKTERCISAPLSSERIKSGDAGERESIAHRISVRVPQSILNQVTAVKHSSKSPSISYCYFERSLKGGKVVPFSFILRKCNHRLGDPALNETYDEEFVVISNSCLCGDTWANPSGSVLLLDNINMKAERIDFHMRITKTANNASAEGEIVWLSPIKVEWKIATDMKNSAVK